MILDIVDSIVLSILPLTVGIMLLMFIFRIFEDRNIYNLLKGLFCLVFTFAIIYSTSLILILDTYHTAIILKEIEATYVQREIIFIGISFIWNVIGSALIFGMWKYVYYKNHNLIYRVKENWKKIGGMKSYGRYKKTDKL